MEDSLPLLFARGSHYDVWKLVGKTFKERICSFLDKQDGLKQHLRFSETPAGRELVERYLAAGDEEYPHYMAEMRGLADGLGLPFLTIFVYNLRLEMERELRPSDPDPCVRKSCSTVLINNGSDLMFGHNEDLVPGTSGSDFIVSVSIDSYTDDRGRHFPAEQFVSHVTPGKLAGTTFGFNKHGYIYSHNVVLVPKPQGKSGCLCQMLMMRSLLASSGITEAAEKARSFTQTLGMGGNLNLGQLGTDNLWSLEIGPDQETGNVHVSVKEISRDVGTYSHFNGFQHLKVPFRNTPDVVGRVARYKEVETPQTINDILRFLGDTTDPRYPLYRDGKPPDTWATCCTVLFDIKKRTMSVYKGNPSGTSPLVVLGMDAMIQQ